MYLPGTHIVQVLDPELLQEPLLHEAHTDADMAPPMEDELPAGQERQAL